MKSRIIVKMAALSTVIVLVALSSGYASTMHAIENREMSVSAKMSDTVFLDPESLTKNKNIYVRVTNTSDFQDIGFGEVLRKDLASKGYSVTDSINSATYILQCNLLYMGQEKQSMTADGMLAGGFAGGALGSTVGSGWKGPTAAGVGGAVVGSVVGGLMASAIHVDTYFGSVDIQIKEPTSSSVRTSVTTEAQQGSSSTVTSHSTAVADKQEYRTRIVVKARQTNIDRQAAAQVISNRLPSQIAGLF